MVVTSKLKAALGLAQLHNKKYKMAAKRFTEVGAACPSLLLAGLGLPNPKTCAASQHEPFCCLASHTLSAACFRVCRAAEWSPARNPCCPLLSQMHSRTICQADSLLLCCLNLAAAAVQVHNELGNSYNDVLSAQDLALFGGLTALATLERSELRSCVIDRISFREFLESHPQVGPLRKLAGVTL